MKIFVTKPAGLTQTVLLERLTKRWTQMNAQIRETKPEHNCQHGAVLTDIWQEAINESDPKIVISETDFIPYDTFKPEMEAMLDENAAVLVHFASRDPQGFLELYSDLAGAWIIGVNRSLLKKDPPLDWLAAWGPRNDAANGAYSALAGEEIFTPNAYDDFPTSLGLEYSGLGYHAFWLRMFDSPPGTVLIADYTIDQHLADLTRRLDVLDLGPETKAIRRAP